MRKFIGLVNIVLTMMFTAPLITTQAHAWGLFDPNHREENLADEVTGFTVDTVNGTTNTLAIARHYLGSGRMRGMPGAWCRAFVNKVLRQGGYYTNSNNTVRDALRIGQRVSHPRPGDLMVMRGHITFFAGYDGHGRLLGLGGNQGGHRGHRLVQYSHYSPSRIVAYIRPVRGHATTIAYVRTGHRHHYRFAHGYHQHRHFAHWHHSHHRYAHRHQHSRWLAYSR